MAVSCTIFEMYDFEKNTATLKSEPEVTQSIDVINVKKI